MFNWLFNWYIPRETEEQINDRRDRNNAYYKKKQILKYYQFKNEIEIEFQNSEITPCPKCGKKPIVEIKTLPEDFCMIGCLRFDIVCRSHYGLHLSLSEYCYKDDSNEIKRLLKVWNYHAKNVKESNNEQVEI